LVNTVESSAYCIFPGYEDLADENGDHPGKIKAELSETNRLLCISPPLRINDEA